VLHIDRKFISVVQKCVPVNQRRFINKLKTKDYISDALIRLARSDVSPGVQNTA